MTLKYVLKKFEKCLFFQILEMDEKLRFCIDFCASNEVRIAVKQFPSLISLMSGDIMITLRGVSKERDFDGSVLQCKDNTSRDILFNKIHDALKEFIYGKSNESDGTVTLYKDGKVVIRYILKDFPFTVYFQILDMQHPESNIPFIASNGMKIESRVSPALEPKIIYLRGNNTLLDLAGVTMSFESNEERDRFIRQAHTALFEWTGINKQDEFTL